MKTFTKDTKESNVKWWAAMDARMRNIANKSHYSAEVQLRVDRMKVALQMVYAGKVYEAYNKKRVSIKIDKPVVQDKQWLRLLEEEWELRGVTKTVTPQGVLYRVI